MKKISILFALILLFICTTLTACSLRKGSDYIGKYNSIFVDSQTVNDSIVFSLEINEDNTFSLRGRCNYEGTWKSYTESGKQQLLCIVESGYIYSTDYPNAWNPYFTLCILDDGTLMATSGVTSSTYRSLSAFCWGSCSMVTLVLFEKVK